MLDLIDWVCSRWQIAPERVVGDAKYGTIQNISNLEERWIKAFLPTSDLTRRTGSYPPDLFHYEAEQDHYICPQGEILPLRARRKSEQVYVYRANKDVCNGCLVKSECSGNISGRLIFRSFFQEYLDKAKIYRQTEAYQ